MSSQNIRILTLLSFIGFLFIFWFFTLLLSHDSFFSVKPYFPDNTMQAEYDAYEEDLEIRNNIKMKKSFDELLRLGRKFTKNKNYHDAAACYFFAKSIFPEREEPRRYLSEAFLTLCAEYGEYCGDAKKEVYYAFKYVKDTSYYYSDLLDMASSLDLFPYLDMHEDDVLPFFYEEQQFYTF